MLYYMKAKLKSALKSLSLSTTATFVNTANTSNRACLCEGSTEGSEEGVSQASLCSCVVLDQRWQLVVVSHEGEGPGLEQGAQAGRQGDLTSLVQNAHVKDFMGQDRIVRPQGSAAHLSASV